VLEQQYRNYHATLDRAWASLQQGDVLVGEGHGYKDVGQYGDCLMTCFVAKGAIGLVTDATVRDARHMLEHGIPVFTGGPSVPGALAHISRDGTAHGLVAVDVNTPIMCDGVCVRPGDIIIGDTDGVIVVPLEIADKVAELGQAHTRIEELSRKLGSEGAPIFDSYLPLVKHVEARGYSKWLDVITRYDGGKYRQSHGDDADRIHGPRPETP
jgi:regulator of RNase E activity RraA